MLWFQHLWRDAFDTEHRSHRAKLIAQIKFEELLIEYFRNRFDRLDSLEDEAVATEPFAVSEDMQSFLAYARGLITELRLDGDARIESSKARLAQYREQLETLDQ